MSPVAIPAWLPILVWAGLVAVCGALLVLGTFVGGASLLTVHPIGLVGGGFIFWAAVLLGRAAWRGQAVAQGALIIASFALMAVMADGWNEPVHYLDYEPFRFIDGLLRALPGLILAVLFAGRRTSAYFADREQGFADDAPDSDPS